MQAAQIDEDALLAGQSPGAASRPPRHRHLFQIPARLSGDCNQPARLPAAALGHKRRSKGAPGSSKAPKLCTAAGATWEPNSGAVPASWNAPPFPPQAGHLQPDTGAGRADAEPGFSCCPIPLRQPDPPATCPWGTAAPLCAAALRLPSSSRSAQEPGANCSHGTDKPRLEMLPYLQAFLKAKSASLRTAEPPLPLRTSSRKRKGFTSRSSSKTALCPP